MPTTLVIEPQDTDQAMVQVMVMDRVVEPLSRNLLLEFENKFLEKCLFVLKCLFRDHDVKLGQRLTRRECPCHEPLIETTGRKKELIVLSMEGRANGDRGQGRKGIE